MLREVILDIETTGLYVDEGEKIVSVGMVELINGQPSGVTYYTCVNPGRESGPHALAVHRLTTEMLQDFSPFAAYAREIRDFIGTAPIVITCRTSVRNGKSYTLDEAFITSELAAAGIRPPHADQWVNVRRLAETMFGHDNARLDALLDRYKVDRSERDEKGHGALLDAYLLAKIYPQLKKDHVQFLAAPPAAQNGGKPLKTARPPRP